MLDMTPEEYLNLIREVRKSLAQKIKVIRAFYKYISSSNNDSIRENLIPPYKLLRPTIKDVVKAARENHRIYCTSVFGVFSEQEKEKLRKMQKGSHLHAHFLIKVAKIIKKESKIVQV